MFDIRQNPVIPPFKTYGIIALVVCCLLACAVAVWAGCNSIPEVVCADLGSPTTDCTTRLAAAQATAHESGQAITVPEWGVAVRPDGQIHPWKEHARFRRQLGMAGVILIIVLAAILIARDEPQP